jgi:hypothetical protein
VLVTCGFPVRPAAKAGRGRPIYGDIVGDARTV